MNKQTPAPTNDAQNQLIQRLERIHYCTEFNDNSLALLVGLVQKIRPASSRNTRWAEQQLLFLINTLKVNSATLERFRALLTHVFIRSDIAEVLTESGIQSEYSFFHEFNKRLRHKILPALKNEGSFLYAINAIFYKKTDHIWIEGVDDLIWFDFFELMGLELNVSDEHMLHQLCKSLYITSTRINSLGVEPDMQRCLNEKELYAFIYQNYTVKEVVDARSQRALSGNLEQYNRLEIKLFDELNACEKLVHKIQSEIDTYGTSLHQTYSLMRIKQLIDRMRMVLDLLNNDGKIDLHRVVRHFKAIIQNENTKNSIYILIRNNIEFLAYRIAEHGRNTGEKYITSTPAEYRKMFKSAMGGGVIISFVAVIKNLFHFLKMAPFWQGFVYSINYAAGFITIYATGSTLATKQPAMTASAIASSLDSKQSNTPNLPELAILISETVRSQTASFIGNLMIVFPLTFCIAFAWNLLFGFPIAEGAQAQALLDAQNPLRSLSILYACFTGVFLYLSGIISGYFDNLSVYGNIPRRMREHPTLKRSFSQRTIDKVADYTSVHLGGIMGNLCLGFFLGMAGFIGYIFGIKFDIRHITVSTGNFAIGLQGLGFNVAVADVIWTTIGVILIGVFNFLVSFALAFLTAMASRKVRFKYYHRFLLYLWRLFTRYPLDFIRPPKEPRKPADFIHHKK